MIINNIYHIITSHGSSYCYNNKIKIKIKKKIKIKNKNKNKKNKNKNKNVLLVVNIFITLLTYLP